MALSITNHIFTTLKESSSLTAIVGTRIYPIVAVNGVSEFPCVTVEVSTGAPEYSKDGPVADNHQVTVYCVSTSYQQMLSMANAVRSALECVEKDYTDYSVTSSQLSSVSEDYQDEFGAYVSALVFDMESTC